MPSACVSTRSRGYGRLVKVDLLLWEGCPSYPEALELVESVVASHDLRDALDAILEGHSPAASDTPPVGCTVKWRNR